MIRLALCALVALSVIGPSQADAQLFKRFFKQPAQQQSQQCIGGQCQTGQCQGGECQLPAAGSPVNATQATPVSDPSVGVVADQPHVRCIAGNSCGSGTICGSNAAGSYVLTNAHVTGTALGRSVSVDCVSNGASQRIMGRTVMTGYSDSHMVDFSIVYVEGLSSKRYMHLLKAEPDNLPLQTTGGPKCVWPQVTKRFDDPRSYGEGLITGTPDAIGGQSGSAIYNQKQQQVALLTWSMNRRCAGQKTIKLWEVAKTRNVLVADLRPEGMTELGDCAGDRPETKSGVFGSCGLIETANTPVRPITENTIQNVVGSDMEDLPIWVAPGDVVPEPEPDPTPDCPDCPKCPDCGNSDNCVQLTSQEKALIEFLRSQQTGLRDGEKAWDWMKIFALVMELIKAIQEGRVG
jgi:hypothetical protein